ncbi:MAG: AsmA family protein [Candidatus Saganbacteria bacterium]|nr:AsmA family protein [Candidatus Saganbacteria bacterium]
MKKALKWLAITTGGLILLAIIAMIAIPLLIPTEMIKNFATEKLSETLNRTVSIESASLNIFEGVKLEGISVSNHKKFSKKPFITAEAFKLKYSFWPLFAGKVLIHEIELISPQILVEKDTRGRSNLEDLTAQPKKKDQVQGQKKDKVRNKGQGKSKIDLIVNNISIKNGQFTYHDYLTGVNELKNLNLRVSGITLALIRPINLDAGAIATYQKKEIPISVSTKIKVGPTLESISVPKLVVKIASEGFSCPIEINKIKDGPEISFNLSSKNLSIDTLIGLLATSTKTPAKKAKPGALTKSIKSSARSFSDKLKIKGTINIEKAILQKLKLDSFNADISLSGKKIWLKMKDVTGYGGKLSLDSRINLANLTYEIKPLNLKGFNAAPFINDFIDSFFPELLNLKNKTEGTLDIFLSLNGRGVEMPAIFDNAKVDGVVVLTKGRLKKIKSLENIAEKYNLSFLKHDILVKGLRAEGKLLKKVLTIKSLDLKDSDLEVAFVGGLNFNNMKYVSGNRLTLKLSPTASQGLPLEFSVFKDERGFVNADFELLGSLYAPIPSPRLEKAIEKTIGKLKIKIEAKKIEIEQKTKKQVEEEAEKLKQKAKEKIKEILKF